MNGDHLSRQDLLSCIELGKALTAQLDPDRLFETILKKISELVPAENWSLLLVDRDSGELSFKVSIGLDLKKLRNVRLKPGEGIAGYVAKEQTPCVVRDVRKCAHFTDRIDRLSGFKTQSLMAVPLIVAGHTVGVLEAVNPDTMSKRALGILTVVGDYMAIAVENTRRYHKYQTLAHQDNLTGLYNTRYFYRALKALLKRSQGSGRPFSLIFMDLDNFKRVVDTYGHLNGSQAIQEVAGTIQDTVSDPSFGVSYGGDEFVVVLPGFDKPQAVAKAEEIRAAMARTLYLCNKGHRVAISASFGVATYPDDATDMERLLNLADAAMFRVKGEGKNCVGTAFVES